MRVVPVAFSRAHVPRFVVPGTAAQHAELAYWSDPLQNTMSENISERNCKVSA